MTLIYALESIETPRLLLRPVQSGDEKAINDAINQSLSLLTPWMPWAEDPSLETTRTFVDNAVLCWQGKKLHDFPMTVIHKADNKVISATGFNEKTDIATGYYEIGYWIHQEYQGQGLVTEFVTALSKLALDVLNAKQVQICTQVENKKSIQVAKRCGFQQAQKVIGDRIDCITRQPADSYLLICQTSDVLPHCEIKFSLKA